MATIDVPKCATDETEPIGISSRICDILSLTNPDFSVKRRPIFIEDLIFGLAI